MIPPLTRWFPLVDAVGYPDKTDVFERRVMRINEEYQQAVKMQKEINKVEELVFELYVKKAEQNQLRLEIFTHRNLDITV